MHNDLYLIIFSGGRRVYGQDGPWRAINIALMLYGTYSTTGKDAMSALGQYNW